jgi:hypothetical protein
MYRHWAILTASLVCSVHEITIVTSEFDCRLENMKGRGNLDDKGIDGTIILNYILKK